MDEKSFCQFYKDLQRKVHNPFGGLCVLGPDYSLLKMKKLDERKWREHHA